MLGNMAAYPNLRRVAPAFARQTGQEVFDLGIEIILDGLAARVR